MTRPDPHDPHRPVVAFRGGEIFERGPLADAWPGITETMKAGYGHAIIVFDAVSGQVVDIDPTRPPEGAAPADAAPRKKPRGRPRLGVVSREVTLLPQHWDWLGEQHGGASAALRRLINQARRAQLRGRSGADAKNAAYRFMTAIAGDLEGYEDALRALFADDRKQFKDRIRSWPEDIRTEADRLAFPDTESNDA